MTPTCADIINFHSIPSSCSIYCLFSHTRQPIETRKSQSQVQEFTIVDRVLFIERCTVIENSSAKFALGDRVKHSYYDNCLIVIRNRDCDHKNKFHVTVQLLTAIDLIMLEN